MRDSIAEYITAATHITPTYNDMPGRPNRATDKICRIVTDIAEAESVLKDNEKKVAELRRMLWRDISQLPDKTEREVLIYRYIAFFPWNKISRLMKMEGDKVFRIHRNSIEHFFDIVLTKKVGLVE